MDGLILVGFYVVPISKYNVMTLKHFLMVRISFIINLISTILCLGSKKMIYGLFFLLVTVRFQLNGSTFAGFIAD